VNKQQKIIIECRVQSVKEPKCTWTREQTTIREDSRHQCIVREITKGEYDIVLEIDKPNANDKGSYKLTAKNEKGEVTSQAIQVNVDEEEKEEIEEKKQKKGSKPKLVQSLRSEVIK